MTCSQATGRGKVEVRDSPHGIFGSWEWCSRGPTKCKEFLGNHRPRRRRHLILPGGAAAPADPPLSRPTGLQDSLAGLIEWLPGWLSSWLVWLSDCQDGCAVDWFDWVASRMAVQLTGLIEAHILISNHSGVIFHRYFHSINHIKQFRGPIVGPELMDYQGLRSKIAFFFEWVVKDWGPKSYSNTIRNYSALFSI